MDQKNLLGSTPHDGQDLSAIKDSQEDFETAFIQEEYATEEWDQTSHRPKKPLRRNIKNIFAKKLETETFKIKISKETVKKLKALGESKQKALPKIIEEIVEEF